MPYGVASNPAGTNGSSPDGVGLHNAVTSVVNAIGQNYWNRRPDLLFLPHVHDKPMALAKAIPCFGTPLLHVRPDPGRLVLPPAGQGIGDEAKVNRARE